MPVMPEPSLQPLRIPTGWEIQWNMFLDTESGFEADDHASIGFGEDLLQLVHGRNSVLIDLGWYPDGDPHGTFRLLAIRKSPDDTKMSVSWANPLKMLESRSKAEIVQAVEDWLRHFAEVAKQG
ncbi:hypothetical protein [Paludisphaera soli]|uniref:hypothetical protein n=1 Tax=Paludisphaera soli TaxID=2712865 RepID=UPI0013ED00FE|nr:hypothetical protein [Paludisphaera soli]